MVYMLSSLLNVVALVISLLALGVSTYLAVRQALVARQANQITVFVDLLREARSPEFRNRERSLWQKIKDYDPALGFAGLPKEQRDDAEVVCSYYSALAYCIAIGVVEHDLAVIPIHYRLLNTWKAVYPFVAAERKIRGDGESFLNLLEDFVAEARQTNTQTLEEEISRRAFPKLAASLRKSGAQSSRPIQAQSSDRTLVSKYLAGDGDPGDPKV
jgi:hypothetical protein